MIDLIGVMNVYNIFFYHIYMESLFPRNICDLISEFIFFDKKCSSPTANIIKTLVSDKERSLVMFIIQKSIVNITEFTINKRMDNRYDCKINLDIILNEDLNGMMFNDYLYF